MSKKEKGASLPLANARISRAINELAALREDMRALQAKASRRVEKIVAGGSCKNSRFLAYVHREGSYWSSPRRVDYKAGVRLVPASKPIRRGA